MLFASLRKLLQNKDDFSYPAVSFRLGETADSKMRKGRSGKNGSSFGSRKSRRGEP